MKPAGSLRKLVVILVLLVLLPAIFYSGYELSSLSTTEGLMTEVYRQQLDAILYSVNQNAWDVANNWANTVSMLLDGSRVGVAGMFDRKLAQFVGKNPSVEAIFVADTNLGRVKLITKPANMQAHRVNDATVLKALHANRPKLERLGYYRQLEYRKLESLFVGDSTSGGQKVVLVFASEDARQEFGFVCIVLDESAVIRDVIARKLNEAAGGRVVLAVLRGDAARPVFTTAPTRPEELKQRRPLWLFPNHFLAIRPQGATIEELVRSRFYRNLSLIIALDVVLLAGAWLLYRTVKRELELVRLRSDFVSNVSHELRTPLALIRMFAETLEMGRIKEEKKQEYYKTILSETERLTRLVNNLLDFSRMEAGRKRYEFSTVDLNAVVEKVLDTYSHHLQSQGFEPVIELGSPLPVIHADAEAVSEAIINVVDNAVKYSDASKFLAVRTGTDAARVFVEVEDHGIGIAPEHQHKIFDTFYRVSSGLVHNTKGSGLGLTLVKHIMDAHGGKVQLKSEVGSGSRFRLMFPAKQSV